MQNKKTLCEGLWFNDSLYGLVNLRWRQPLIFNFLISLKSQTKKCINQWVSNSDKIFKNFSKFLLGHLFTVYLTLELSLT